MAGGKSLTWDVMASHKTTESNLKDAASTAGGVAEKAYENTVNSKVFTLVNPFLINSSGHSIREESKFLIHEQLKSTERMQTKRCKVADMNR
jgi:hypothetical protein